MRTILFCFTIIVSGTSYSQSSEEKNDSIVQFISCPAEFHGGHQELLIYIGDNINYSDIDSNKFDYGTIFITFFVEADGHITDMELLNKNRENICNKGATPFKSMPNWKPACDGNGPIRERVRIPVIIEIIRDEYTGSTTNL
jgi:protein TonB